MTPLKPEHKLSKALALHPDVLPYIISLNPHDLERLNNPMMQELLPKRITLARLAVMLNMSAESLIEGIYEAAGMKTAVSPIPSSPPLPMNPKQPPNWFSGDAVTVIDLLEGDERLDVDPFVSLFPAIKQLEVGEVLLLKHKWHPQPLYDVFQKLEVTHYAVRKSPDEWWIYLRKGREQFRVKKQERPAGSPASMEHQMFTKAIVRTPSKSMVDGLTSADLGVPDYKLALSQHTKYIQALQTCGVKVEILAADEQYPDSTFVEDVALLTKKCAIITRPGALTRRGETAVLPQILSPHYTHIEKILAPGIVEAGDIMMVGSHFYIGLSARTNEHGAQQIIAHLEKYGMSGSMVTLKEVLHLKTGLAYLEKNNLLACGEFLTEAQFQQFNILEIDADESYAANCIWVNSTVLIPKGYPKAQKTIQQAGYPIIEIDVSEFRKLDGGLSCLSLRF